MSTFATRTPTRSIDIAAQGDFPFVRADWCCFAVRSIEIFHARTAALALGITHLAAGVT